MSARTQPKEMLEKAAFDGVHCAISPIYPGDLVESRSLV